MKNLLKKVRGDKKGFTLAELLVVVAIIGILVAISIPIFTAQLNKATKATNQANLRAAKAAAVAAYLTDNSTTKTSCTYVYQVSDGTVSAEGQTLGNSAKAATIDNANNKTKIEQVEVTVTNAATNNVTFKVLPAAAGDGE